MSPEKPKSPRIEPPEGWVPDERRKDGRARCQQWLFKKGRQCNANAMTGVSAVPHPIPGYKRKCRVHGGMAISGIAHSNYKTGRYGKGLGESRARDLERLLHDDELLNLNDNIALLDLRLSDLVGSLLEGGNPAELWGRALRSWDLMWRATARGDHEAVGNHRIEVDSLLREGTKEISTWDEIQDRSEARRRLTDSEVRRREKMQYLVMIDDALQDYLTVGRVVRSTILSAKISDEIKTEILKEIQSGLARFMQVSTSQRALSRDDLGD